MSSPTLKRTVLVAGAVLLALVSAVALLAAVSPQPSSLSTPSLESAAPLPAGPAMITWTPTSTEAIVSPGETKTLSVSFVSSKNIRRASLQISPELAALVHTDPMSFERIRKGEQNTLTLIVAPSASSTLGTITGSIQLLRGKVDASDTEADDEDRRDARKLLPQALAVTVNIWQPYDNPALGIHFLMPPGMVAEASTDGQGSLIYVHDDGEEFPNGIAVRRHTRDLTSVLSDITATLRIASESQQVISGQTWTIYDFVDPSGGPEFLDAFTTVNGVVYQVGGKALSVSGTLRNFLTTIVFN